MKTQPQQKAELQENYKSFSDVLGDPELVALGEKHGIKNIRNRKLSVYHFFWLMVMSASEASHRGSILQLIGFFLGAMVLFPEQRAKLDNKLSKTAVSKRLNKVSWYFFRGVYRHLLDKYKHILAATDLQVLAHFKETFAVDGSVIKRCKQVENLFQSVHKDKASLKMNVKYSLHLAVVTKLQVRSGKRHDSRFSFVTQQAQQLYLVDLGYWSFTLMQKIIDAHSFFVMRLKRSGNPLIVQVANPEFQHLIGQRLADIHAWLNPHSDLPVIDLTVQLSSAKKPRFTADIRLVGLVYQDQWRFYITNIWDTAFTPARIYALDALRWPVEIFFNLIKNSLALQHIISRNKNGIMIEIYAALIFHLLTRIIIALAAQKAQLSIHHFSFERAAKLVKGFLVSQLALFFHQSRHALDAIFPALIEIVAQMARRQSPHPFLDLHQRLYP